MAVPSSPALTPPVAEKRELLDGLTAGAESTDDRASTAAGAGLHREEVLRTRWFARVSMVLTALTIAVLPLTGGDSNARWIATVGMLPNFAVAWWVARSLRDESRYSLRQTLAFGFAGIVGGYCAMWYFGVFSPAVVMIPVGLYFFSPARSARATLAIYATCAALQAALTAMVAVHWVADRGLVRADGVPAIGKLVILLLVEAAFAASYLVARSHRIGTERVLAENQAVQARMMMSDRLASMGALAAGVGHEVNNPLSFVIANLELLVEELQAGEPIGPAERARIDEILREALSGCGRVATIVKDLNALCREASDHVVRPIDVRAVIDSALNVAAGQLRYRARIVRDFADVPRVMGSDSRLGQVILNLLVNAAQAFPEGPAERNEVRITVRLAGERALTVEVADNGPGMPPEVVARAFEPFFTTKKAGEGSGLGLAICRSIVTAFGGDIELRSAVGAGTTVCITLPTTNEATASAPPSSMRLAPRPAMAPEGHVLVVDDEPAIGKTLARSLKAHQVEVVTSGLAALEACAQRRFDLILCDLMMPGMTGMDVHDALQARDPEAARKMFFMTGGAYTDRARAFVAQLPERTLEKPVDLEKLRKLARVASERARGAHGASAPRSR